MNCGAGVSAGTSSSGKISEAFAGSTDLEDSERSEAHRPRGDFLLCSVPAKGLAKGTKKHRRENSLR